MPHRARSRTAITLLNQQGSSVTQGSMQLIPVGNSIVIYVRPFYAQGRQAGSFPQFQFVVVYWQDLGARSARRPSQDGLNQLFRLSHGRPRCNAISAARPGRHDTTSTTTTTTTPGTATTTPATPRRPPRRSRRRPGVAQDLLNQAAAKLDQAQTALEAGDLGEYQTLVNEARTLVKQAQHKQRSQAASSRSVGLFGVGDRPTWICYYGRSGNPWELVAARL